MRLNLEVPPFRCRNEPRPRRAPHSAFSLHTLGEAHGLFPGFRFFEDLAPHPV